MKPEIQILPSLLASDVGCLAAEAKRAEAGGADALHIDIMDAHFVPNLSFGPDVVQMARAAVRIPLSVHLMMTNPERYMERFIRAGADILLIHIEIKADVRRALADIRAMGAKPGITINPDTPAESVFDVLDLVDEVLVMSVHPGYGGQKFIAKVLPKTQALRHRIVELGQPIGISMDGGIDFETAPAAVAAGVNVLIAGSSLFGPGDMGERVARLRRISEAA